MKVLGPKLDVVGKRLADLTDDGVENFGRVVKNAASKTSPEQLEQPWSPNKRVLKAVIDEAAVTPKNTTSTAAPTQTAYGYLGAKQRHTTLPTGVIEMGARIYNPHIGRFLQTDPVYGGSANAYDYVSQDPCNATDLSGENPAQDGWRSLGYWVNKGIGSGVKRVTRFVNRLGKACSDETVVGAISGVLDFMTDGFDKWPWDSENLKDVRRAFRKPTTALGKLRRKQALKRIGGYSAKAGKTSAIGSALGCMYGVLKKVL